MSVGSRYAASAKDAAGDTCSWCGEPATTKVVIATAGRSKVPYRVPACDPCKRRIELGVERDKRSK